VESERKNKILGGHMLTIGCHLSSAKGFLAMGKNALAIDANTFQFFTRNPRGTKAKAMDPADVERFLLFAKEHAISRILAHAPYTLNACSADPNLRTLAKDTMKDDLMRMEYTPGNCYNFHPGSHVGQGVEVGIEQISDMLNEILTPEFHTTVLLETMAGKGSEVGREFEELREILDRVHHNELMGVCLDTCHVWDAGYDIAQDLDAVLHRFDEVIGLHRLKAIHLNDSQNPLGAHKDRHAKIGEGFIGEDALKRIVTHPVLKDLPFYLETPNELPGYAKEILIMRNA
jgi:deoxyribonuclease-4